MNDTERIYKKRMVPLIRDMFLRFYSYREHWTNAVNVVAELDVLCSLATFSKQANMCKPSICLSYKQDETTSQDNEDDPDCFIDIKGLRHPLFLNDNFVPNDVILGRGNGEEETSCLLITGSNMGGKSTLLRSACLAVVLAQIGCYVPADAYRATLIDRIFTRIGAQDNVLASKSTFFVELEETN